MEINVKKTIENTVTVKDEFPFYVDELSADDEMPTYLGNADEKYSFDEMDDAFFEFIQRKIGENGIFIRLIHVTETVTGGCVTLDIEAGSLLKTVTAEREMSCESVDYGIKIKGEEVLLGTTVFDERPHFEKISEDDFLSEIIRELAEGLIRYD